MSRWLIIIGWVRLIGVIILPIAMAIIMIGVWLVVAVIREWGFWWW